MANCIYCGENAGFLKDSHSECQKKHEVGFSEMVEAAAKSARTGYLIDEVQGTMADISLSHRVSTSSIRQAMCRGFHQAVEQALEDDIVTAEEEGHLKNFLTHFGIEFEEYQGYLPESTGDFKRLDQAVVLRDANAGCLFGLDNEKQYMLFPSPLPFNLQRSEALVWMFYGVDYLEQRVEYSYVGASAGLSVRMAPGVYVGTSSSRGRPVETSSVTYLATGLLGITTEHIYFTSERRSFRVPYGNIVAFKDYSNAIGITSDAVNGTPFMFAKIDGWFIYNLITSLARFSTGR